jgi:hypothetical protein
MNSIFLQEKPSSLHSRTKFYIAATLRKTKTHTPEPVIIS